MMADGGFEKLAAQDAQHRAFKGDGLKKGDNVTAPGRKGIGTVMAQDETMPHAWWVNWADGDKRLERGSILTKVQPRKSGIPKPPMKFLTYQDMVNLPDPDWLIEGLIMEKTSALLFGKSNSFKSFLAIDMGCSVATGHIHQSWHDKHIMDGYPVLYVATEGALGVAKQRIPGWYEARGIPETERDNLDLYPQEIALDDDKAVDDLLRSCAISAAMRDDDDDWRDPAYAYRLVIIDIFGASMMGPETSDETARAWVRNINRIMRTMKCAVLTVAHTGWADETRARMHTHFWGSFDTRLKAEGDKDSRTTVLSIDRHKDADSEGQWGFRLDVVKTPTGGTTLLPRLCDEVETKQKRRVSGKPAVALQALSEALIDHGRTIAGPNYPTCPVVSVDQWSEMCRKHGLTDSDNPDTIKKAFQRAKNTLIEKGLVRQFDGDVWKVQADPKQGGQKGTVPGQSPDVHRGTDRDNPL